MKYLKNLMGNSADFYIYGEIVDEKVPDFWTGDISSTEVDPNELKDELDEAERQGVRDLNIYINSPGGSVVATSAIMAQLKRFRQRTGAQLHSYIDGLAASAASFLALVADDVNIYSTSIMMIHKPLLFSYGNADDLQRDIDLLNSIEDNTIIPAYMSKAKVEESEIKSLVGDETWFNGNPDDEKFIGNYFVVNYLDQTKPVTACASKKLFNFYKHVPEQLKNLEKPESEETSTNEEPKENAEDNKEVDKMENVDYSAFDATIKLLTI